MSPIARTIFRNGLVFVAGAILVGAIAGVLIALLISGGRSLSCR
jgi:hypothetical protein